MNADERRFSIQKEKLFCFISVHPRSSAVKFFKFIKAIAVVIPRPCGHLHKINLQP
jgi:hypothetical protein